MGTFILEGTVTDQEAEGLDALADSDMMEIGVSALWETVAGLWQPVIKPMLVGAIPLGVIFGIVFYILTRWAAGVFHQARIKRMARKQASILSENHS